jgi:hypothetical protein
MHNFEERYRARTGADHKFVIKISRGTLKSQKERADGSAIGRGGLGVIFDGKGESTGW